MVKPPFAGKLEPGKTFTTVLAELTSWWGVEANIPFDAQMIARHLDELRNRVDLSDGPDQVVAFTKAGDVPHSLGSTPRFWMLRDWSGTAPADFSVVPDKDKITVTCSDGSSGHIALWK